MYYIKLNESLYRFAQKHKLEEYAEAVANGKDVNPGDFLGIKIGEIDVNFDGPSAAKYYAARWLVDNEIPISAIINIYIEVSRCMSESLDADIDDIIDTFSKEYPAKLVRKVCMLAKEDN